MGKVAKQSIQTTIFSYLGVVIGYVNVLWLYPYALDASELGTFRTIQDLGLLFVPFAQLGVGHGITRFFPQLKTNQSAFLSYGLLFSMLGFALVSTIFLGFKAQIISLFAVNSPAVIDFLGVVLLITLFALLSSILDAYSRSYVKVAVPTLVREVFLRLLTGILVGLYLLKWLSFPQVMQALVLVYGLAFLAMLVYLLWLGVLKLDFSWNTFPKGFRSSFVQFSLITFLATAASTLIMKIDSIMVSSMISLEANAIYTIAFSMALVIELPRRAISQVVMPVISDHFSTGNLREINKLYQQVSNRQLYICLLLFIGICANLDALYYFIPNRAIYEQGKYVVILIGLGKLCDVVFSVNSEILVFSKHYHFNLFATIIMSMMIIALNYLLIPEFGIEGAALASVVVMFLFNLVKYLFLKIKLGFDPFSSETLKISLVGIIALIPAVFDIFSGHPILSIILTSSLVLGLYLISSRLIGVGSAEWEWVKSRIKKSGS
ncbi:polysaccharide biosynthesis C-terminal domain-containing protein [Algoriphagus halophytocola]|uniref:Polysaccharide biosynthesis C-terminal domain-containing protein n=1 Tax=Algoriphagus halophytocola TaxID=2991499 RepID=A0ABY6MLT0_9BACT|nr:MULTISPECIES: polysaccharide biosynthesis C-terminal domain-containing protein [unclassified Algoriphagus]UZD23246.1 polysaccharide biosynthesis C-terminal domain-containing protein [Algoriphagus sp. TR-M5]WBL44540.1 polysaccharide biosynthesis C-terminal domain-containing protein [Algoriphagus sp. TR-M9]